MSQNTSHAVMAQRHEAHDSLDFFPTPPWATRAFCRHVLPAVDIHDLKALTVWEPACGDGAMARPLAETFGRVIASDIHPYGFGDVLDFIGMEKPHKPHWVITNPPFRLGEQFVQRALEVSTRGAAMLVRTAFLESLDRYRLYQAFPPALVAQFVERVPMVRGRLDRKASTATSYCWIVWRHGSQRTEMMWIPPSRKLLDRDADWPVAA